MTNQCSERSNDIDALSLSMKKLTMKRSVEPHTRLKLAIQKAIVLCDQPLILKLQAKINSSEKMTD